MMRDRLLQIRDLLSPDGSAVQFIQMEEVTGFYEFLVDRQVCRILGTVLAVDVFSAAQS